MFNIEKILSVITIVFCLVAITVMLFGLRAEIVIAAVSGIIALIALQANIQAGKETRKHNRLTVKPFLRCVREIATVGDARLTTLMFVNAGVGPALIKKFILLDGDEIVSCNNNFLGYIFLIEGLKPLVLEPDDTRIGLFTGGDVIQEGEEHIVWKIKYLPQSGARQFTNKINFLVEYQSIYQDKVFIFDSREQRKINNENFS